ncbi:phosphoesterase, partial [Streptomyces sp. NPDC051133]
MEIPDFGIPRPLAERMSMAEQYEYLHTRMVPRRTVVTASAVAGGLLAGRLSGTRAAAHPGTSRSTSLSAKAGARSASA